MDPAGALDQVPDWAGSWLWLDEGMAIAAEADFAEAEAENCRAAVTAIEDAFRTFPGGKPFCSAAGEDVFASGYCFESY